MKTIQHIIYFVFILIAVSVLLFRCRPEINAEEITCDTLAPVDTEKIRAAVVVNNVTPGADTLIPTGAIVVPIVHPVLSVANTSASHLPLILIINNLASVTAPVVVGVYKAGSKFLYKEARVKEYIFIPNGNSLTVNITDLDYNEYAVAVYQDANSNGKFDKTFIGLPKEAYAFSNNFKPLVKAPCYDDCKFAYASTTNTLMLNLIK